MLQRINFFKIINDHLKTLRKIDSAQERLSFSDYFLFFILPYAIGVLLAAFRIEIKSHLTDMITIVSIIGGFLFNFLAIIYGLMDKLQADAEADPVKKIFVRQVHVNISFNILVSLFLLISLVIYTYLPGKYCDLWPRIIFDLFTAFVYFLLIVFFLTMLMVLTRVYILLKKD